jgi:hypothetical protein
MSSMHRVAPVATNPGKAKPHHPNGWESPAETAMLWAGRSDPLIFFAVGLSRITLRKKMWLACVQLIAVRR